MKYWRVYGIFGGKEIGKLTWAIEYEDGSYLTIAKKNDGDRGWISKSRTFPIDNLRGNKEVLKEVPKESVLEALKSVLEILDLPQEINILKHKFNYAEE